MKGFVTVSEAAKIKNVTRQAIYLAIRLKKLKAYMHEERWRIFLIDLNEYDSNRYSRVLSKCNGELIYNEAKGCITMEKASIMMGVPAQKLYYAARTGLLKAVRKNNAWVIKVPDLLDYQKKCLNKKLSKRRAR